MSATVKRKAERVEGMSGASLVAQMVKTPPASSGDMVRSLGQEDPPEEEMVTHSSVLAGRSPWTEEPGGLHSSWGCRRIRQDLVIQQQQGPAECRSLGKGFSYLNWVDRVGVIEEMRLEQ